MQVASLREKGIKGIVINAETLRKAHSEGRNLWHGHDGPAIVRQNTCMLSQGSFMTASALRLSLSLHSAMLISRKRPLPLESESVAVKRARILPTTCSSPRVTPSSTAYPTASSSFSTSVAVLISTRNFTDAESDTNSVTTRDTCSRSLRSRSRSPPPLNTSSSATIQESLAVDQQARLSKQYQDTFDRLWSGNMVVYKYTAGPYELITRLGLWTGTREESVELFESSPDLVDTIKRARKSGQLSELCSYRKSSSSP